MFFHHESIIDNTSFNLICSGIKKIKFYLNDMKRFGLKSGDFIKYISNKSGESIIVLVKEIIYKKNSEELATKLGCDGDQKIDLISYLNEWFSSYNQKKYGLIAVQIEVQKER